MLGAPMVGSISPVGPKAPLAVRVGANEVRLLRDGAAAFPAMLDAIARAQKEVLLEMYWVGDDRVGGQFRAALRERALAGVHVRVLYDAVGSLETPETFWTPLVAAGAEVQEYSPISPFKRRFHLERIAYRDHRKVLIVDGEVGFAGGINIGEHWAPLETPASAWRDDDIEIRGPAARALRAAFYDVWRRAGRRSPPDVAKSVEVDSGVRILTNRIEHRPNRAIRRAYLLGVRRATVSIDIANAYFLPDIRFLHALRRAAGRGVRVRLLVPEHSDVRIVALAMDSLYGRLLADGVGVFAYLPRVLHAKTAIFDGRFTMIGSHNLDAASSRFNLECNVVVDSAEFAATVRESFERDLHDAKQLDLEAWRSRPAWLRLFGWFAALFERIL
jgi:cardiolipin synthase A/B